MDQSPESEWRSAWFASVPTGVDSWIGDVAEVALERELIPLRFQELDFFLVFVSPRAEAMYDEEFMRQALNTVDAEFFTPGEQSRLVKFHRAEAKRRHFNPNAWKLSHPRAIFGLAQLLASALLVYEAQWPVIEQFLFLPSTGRLDRFYTRVISKVRAALPQYTLISLLPSSGALHAYEKTQAHRREVASHEGSWCREDDGNIRTGQT